MVYVAIVCKSQKEELARLLPELIGWHGRQPRDSALRAPRRTAAPYKFVQEHSGSDFRLVAI